MKNLFYGKKNRFMHEDIGYNYRLPNISAAIGLGQLENFKKAHEVGLKLKILQDSLHLEKKRNLVTELEEKYQLKNKETENTLLKLKQQKQTAIISQQKLFNYTLIAVATLLALLHLGQTNITLDACIKAGNSILCPFSPSLCGRKCLIKRFKPSMLTLPSLGIT